MGSDENSQELSNRRSSLTVYGLGGYTRDAFWFMKKCALLPEETRPRDLLLGIPASFCRGGTPCNW